jgi:BirA family biotin operon repressor/biotin-[acetyl-CoA-carboxylase] ligase
LSLGFRPTWLSPGRAWQLGAIASLAMADAAEETAGLADGTIRLKWPNDLVVEADGPAAAPSPGYKKLAGVLGETSGLGTDEPTVIVGLGINAGWPAAEFPLRLATGMTSLHESSGGRPIDRAVLLDAFLGRLEVRVDALRAGRFDAAGWRDRELAAGRVVWLERPDGSAEVVRALGADLATGALLVEDPAAPGRERAVLSGEIRHLRLAPREV